MNAAISFRNSQSWNKLTLTKTTLQIVSIAPNDRLNKTILTAAQLAKLHPISTNILRTVHTEQRQRHRLQLMDLRRCHHRNQQTLPTNCRFEKPRESMRNCPETLIEGQQSTRLLSLAAQQ
jgi:hypothetical protein